MKRWLIRMGLILLALGLVLAAANFNWDPLSPHLEADRIVVEKSLRRMTLYRKGKPLKVYRIALGTAASGHKVQEGDRKTPEGHYRIQSRNAQSSCHLALRVSYPNPADREHAAGLKRNPGGDIMIHGLKNGFGWIGSFHTLRDWTAGCIAVTNDEMDEIWRSVPTGTPIEIRP